MRKKKKEKRKRGKKQNKKKAETKEGKFGVQKISLARVEMET